MNTISKSALLVSAAGFLALPTAAMAESPLADAPAFTMSVGAGSSLASLDVPGASLNNRLGITFSKWVLFASVDRVSGNLNNDGDVFGASLTTAGIGGRWYLKPLRVKKATPYIMAQAFTVVPMLNTGEDAVDDAASNVQSYGIAPAYGGEYALSDSASLSGEIGLSIWRGAYEEGDAKVEATVSAITSSMFLNFYF
jgi:hypothetical protein